MSDGASSMATVNFDHVFGTLNPTLEHVDMFYRLHNDAFKEAARPDGDCRARRLCTKVLRGRARASWTNEGFSPCTAPGTSRPPTQHGNNTSSEGGSAWWLSRMVEGLPVAFGYRGCGQYPVNRASLRTSHRITVRRVNVEPDFEGQVHAFNMFAYVSRRSDHPTWNPTVIAVILRQPVHAATEEHALPISMANNRVEWFIEATDETHLGCGRQEHRHRAAGK